MIDLPRPSATRDLLVMACVIVISALVAAMTFAEFSDVAYERFTSFHHDRSNHYLYGIWLALDVRQFDVAQLAVDLELRRPWPPLFGVAEAAALLALGFDVRVASIVSIFAWVGTSLVAFLLARRLSMRGGNYAGCLAALFVLSSPAHRIYATDTMLESLGACLTLSAVYAYVRALQDPTTRNLRALGLVCTLLLFEKYNYWLIVIFGLAIAELVRAPERRRHLAALLVQSLPRGWPRAVAMDPLCWCSFGATATAIAILALGGTQFEVFGRRISMTSADGPLQVAYWAIFLRVILSWRKGAAVVWERLVLPARAFLLWHGLPLALLLLLPKRVGSLLFYVSPANTPMEWIGVTQGIYFYADVFARDYHAAVWSAVIAIGLAGLTVLSLTSSERWKCAKGLGGPVALVAVASVMVLLHPHHQSRFVHSWLPNVWALAGVGAAMLFFGGGAVQPSWQRCGFAGAAMALILALQVSDEGLLAPIQTADRSTVALEVPTAPPGGLPTIVRFADAYLPDLMEAKRSAFLATIPMGNFVEWSFYERYPDREAYAGFYEPARQSSSEAERFADLEAWLAATGADTLVLVDIAPTSHLANLRYERFASIPRLLENIDRYRRISVHPIDDFEAVVTVWRLVSASRAET